MISYHNILWKLGIPVSTENNIRPCYQISRKHEGQPSLAVIIE